MSLADQVTVLIDTGRARQAIVMLTGHLASEPGDVAAICLLARAHLDLKDFETALDTARQATSVDPHAEWPWRLQSIALGRLARLELACDAADQAVRCGPSTYQTHLRRAEGMLALDRDMEAWQSASEAVRLAPNSAAAWITLGNVELRYKRLGEARTSFERALSIDPTSMAARNNLAVVDLRRRRLGRAVSGFVDAARADPRAELAGNNLGLVVRYLAGLFGVVVWLGSIAISTQNDTDRPLTSGARVTAAATSAVLVILLLLAVAMLRRGLGDRLWLVVGRALRGTRRLMAAVTLDLLALLSMISATLAPSRVASRLLVTSSVLALLALFVAPTVRRRRRRRSR